MERGETARTASLEDGIPLPVEDVAQAPAEPVSTPTDVAQETPFLEQNDSVEDYWRRVKARHAERFEDDASADNRNAHQLPEIDTKAANSANSPSAQPVNEAKTCSKCNAAWASTIRSGIRPKVGCWAIVNAHTLPLALSAQPATT